METDSGDVHLTDGSGDEPLEFGKLLLGTPTLVWENVLKYLGKKELLSLRRVCKSTKALVGDSIGSSRDGYCITIENNYYSWKTFEAATRSGVNITELYINNPGDDEGGGMSIYNSPGVTEFLQTYGSRIRKLKVRSFGTFFSDLEFAFFDSLTNLRELTIRVVDAQERKLPYSTSEYESPLRFPSCFRNLRVLKLADVLSPRNIYTNYHWDLVNACPHLEHLRFPIASQDNDLSIFSRREAVLSPVIEYLKKQIANGNMALKILDLKFLSGFEIVNNYESTGILPLLKFLREKFHSQVNLLNVHAELFGECYPEFHELVQQYRQYDSHIISITSLTSPTSYLQLMNLAKIQINSTSRTVDSFLWAWQELGGQQDFIFPWPKLKTLSIVVDGATNPRILNEITHLLFRRDRSSVKKLSIAYEDSSDFTEVIRCRDIAQNFQNLTILEIVAWDINNRSFLRLWEGLRKLKELTIAHCPQFGNRALIGPDVENPTFLKLTELRKLTITIPYAALQLGTIISDRAFRDVFSNMRLKEFYIRCDYAFQTVTETGILSLLNGVFGKSIEKFPFKNWSVQSLTNSEFQKLGKRFRSIL